MLKIRTMRTPSAYKVISIDMETKEVKYATGIGTFIEQTSNRTVGKAYPTKGVALHAINHIMRCHGHDFHSINGPVFERRSPS